MSWRMTNVYEDFRTLVDLCNRAVAELNIIADVMAKIIAIKEAKGDLRSRDILKQSLQDIKQKKDEIETLSKSNAKDKDIIEVTKKQLLEAINELAVKQWDNTLYLSAVKKQLALLQIEIQKNLMNESISQTNILTFSSQEILNSSSKKFDKGYTQVYILLYQYEGTKLANWEHALRAISKHNVNRPTYRNEQNIQELIRSKGDLDRYGYAIVNIKEDDILPQEVKKFDIFNCEILLLKEGAVKNFNIVGFVHANKKCYSFEDNILTYYGDLAQK